MTFGKRYFSELRASYGSEVVASALDVKDDALPCDPKLLEAVRASRSGQESRDKLMQWLQTAGPCNQTESVGLLSHPLELRPTLGGVQFPLCLEGWRYHLRHRLHGTFPSKFEYFKGQSDSALTQAWLAMKANGLPPALLGCIQRPRRGERQHPHRRRLD